MTNSVKVEMFYAYYLSIGRAQELFDSVSLVL